MAFWHGPPLPSSGQTFEDGLGSFSQPRPYHWGLLFGYGSTRRSIMLWDIHTVPYKLAIEANVVIQYDPLTMEAQVVKNRFGRYNCSLEEAGSIDWDDDA